MDCQYHPGAGIRRFCGGRSPGLGGIGAAAGRMPAADGRRYPGQQRGGIKPGAAQCPGPPLSGFSRRGQSASRRRRGCGLSDSGRFAGADKAARNGISLTPPLLSFPCLPTVLPAQVGIQNGTAKDRHTTHRAFLDSRLRGNDGNICCKPAAGCIMPSIPQSARRNYGLSLSLDRLHPAGHGPSRF